MLIKAYAKINLLLDILGIRPDGYHELETVMQTLALHDLLEISPAGDIEIVVEGADLPVGPENLVHRAACLLRKRTGYAGGARIKLAKMIPLAAGLAGGSADAAAVLRGLNRLWDLGLETDDLMKLGAEIGSDVPFCIRGGTALARGRGEAVTQLAELPIMGVVLIKPFFGVSTAEVYRLYDRIASPTRPNCQVMLEAVARGDGLMIAANLGNVLEPATISLHPVIAGIKDKLAQVGAMGVLMSGSGPTVFGLFPDYEAAVRAANNIDPHDLWVSATHFNDPVL